MMKPHFVYRVVIASPVFSGLCFSVAEQPPLRHFNKALKGSFAATPALSLRETRAIKKENDLILNAREVSIVAASESDA
jgi:hypothetical protein